MFLALTPDQLEIQQQAGRFLQAQITRERRLAWDALPAGHDDAFWRAAAELGWFGFGLPSINGGQGASLVEVGLLIEACGRHVAPFGIFAAICGGLALNALGSAAQKKQWLPGVGRGTTQIALAITEAAATRVPAAFGTVLKRRRASVQLDGRKDFVLQGVTADAFLVAARDGQGVSVVLVPRDTPGVQVASFTGFAKDRQSTVQFKKVTLSATALCGAPAVAWPKLEKLRRLCAALLCADLIGGADQVVATTVKYVCEREQFGAKLATFQAVQQIVANMAIDLEGSRHTARQALWRLGEGLAAEREIAIAKAWCGRAYRDITLLGHQLHGGAGYVVEHELHRHTLRAKQAELLFGSTEESLDELADLLKLAPR